MLAMLVLGADTRESERPVFEQRHMDVLIRERWSRTRGRPQFIGV